MNDSLSRGGVFYGRTALIVSVVVVLTALAQLIR